LLPDSSSLGFLMCLPISGHNNLVSSYSNSRSLSLLSQNLSPCRAHLLYSSRLTSYHLNWPCLFPGD
jgi:hypothetical protein